MKNFKKAIKFGSISVAAGVSTIQTASAGVVADALAGNTVAADITEAGAFIIGLAVLALGIRWTKATFF